MNIKPRLVDPAWFPKPKPTIIIKKLLKPVVDAKSNNSLIINIIGIMILMIGIICIYHRHMDREQQRVDNNNLIIGFNEYVKDNIK
tara:strand:- start:971 stop:1228 length:258 start_codon:yes stop_codon:yes gene_type:complete